MTNRRMTRVNELLRREIGTSLYRVVNNANFDMAAITVTRVVTNNNLRSAEVHVSIRDHEGQEEAMLALLRRRRVEIQKIISKNVVLKYTPRLSFKLDTSLAEGDRVLSVLENLEQASDEGPPNEDGNVQVDDER